MAPGINRINDQKSSDVAPHDLDVEQYCSKILVDLTGNLPKQNRNNRMGSVLRMTGEGLDTRRILD